jgi:hypothetical protein
MKDRNLGLVAALATVSQGFQDYRKGVTEKYGKEVDDQLRNHTETKVFEETSTDENGKTKKSRKRSMFPHFRMEVRTLNSLILGVMVGVMIPNIIKLSSLCNRDKQLINFERKDISS